MTWEDAAERGWQLRPGVTLDVLVAERGSSRVYAGDEKTSPPARSRRDGV